MTAELYLDSPAKNYRLNSTNHVWAFPPVGTAVKLDQVREEIHSFEGILGAIIRHTFGFDQSPPDTEHLSSHCVQEIMNHVSTENEEELSEVIRDLYFDGRGDKMRRFALRSLAYLEPQKGVHKKSYSSILNLGVFFSRVFMPETFADIAKDSSSATHILDKAMLASLPKLGKRADSRDPPLLRILEAELIRLFRQDLSILANCDGLLLMQIDSLIRIYLFQYLCELTRYLNRSVECLRQGMPCEDARLEGLYFLVEGERASSSRLGVTEGWRSVKDDFSSVFSHINCLELLNHLQLPDSIALDYAAIASLESSENLRKIKQLAKEFVEVASEPNNRSVKFSNGENFLSDMNSVETCSAAVHVIWYWIDYHINHTGDKARVVKDVAKWFGGFGRGTLLQQRGRLGYVSVLPLTYLHLW